MLNYALKYFSPTAIASVPLGEPIIASIFGFLIFSESIPSGAMISAPIILGGIFIVLKYQDTN
jgi:drug/metabolite transporter (DMT)-like permease